MTRFGETHLILFMATVAFIALTMFLCAKLPRHGQNIMFLLGALLCAGGIFFRYGMGLGASSGLNWQTLGMQMMQVCNFNMILVLLMLVPKCELARQYSIMFSMFAASTTLVSLPSVWATLNWWDLEVLNSWINHTFAIALPLWMLAAGRLKPQRKYVLPTLCSVAVYYAVAYIISEALIAKGVMTAANGFSFIYTTDGIIVFELLWKLIPMPFFYLVPLAPVLYGFFWLLARLFQNYKVQPFSKAAARAAEAEAAAYAAAEAAAREAEATK